MIVSGRSTGSGCRPYCLNLAAGLAYPSGRRGRRAGDGGNLMRTIHNLKEFPRDGALYIYGAGDGGILIRQRLDRFYGVTITAFIDRQKTGLLDGIPILSPDRLLAEVDRGAAIIIAAQAHADIGRFLASAGFTNIYNAFPYVTLYVDDIRHQRRVALDAPLIDRLLMTDPGVAAGLTAGTVLDDALFGSLFVRLGWPGRLALLDGVVMRCWPPRAERAAQRAALADFLAQVLRTVPRDEGAAPACRLLCLLSADPADRERAGAPQADGSASALAIAAPALAALAEPGTPAHGMLFGAGDQGPGILPASHYHDQQRTHLADLDGDPERDLIHRSWFDPDSANSFMIRRFFDAVRCLRAGGDGRWLTVGDGRFGLDAWMIGQMGFTDVVATDISDSLLKEAARHGNPVRYRVENAEALSDADDSVDYVLCKESYHHFPRPMLALYEMLRVARRAVVLIEPRDPLIDWPLMPDQIGRYDFETSGNYIYSISRREMAKVAAGLGLPAVAFKGLNALYIRGAEFSPASMLSPIFAEMTVRLREQDEKCRKGQAKEDLLMVVLFKQGPDPAILAALRADGWDVEFLPRNPYLRPAGG